MREMKDSGIAWIGEIPLGWEVFKLKYVASVLDEHRMPITADKRNQNAEVLYDYYGASGVIDKIDGYTIDDHVMLIGEDGANLLLRNLPLMYEVNGKAWINNHAHILKPQNRMAFKYLFYALESSDIKLYITGSAQPKLNQENLVRIPIVSPPINVQQAIAAYLDKKCAEIDSLTADIQTQIDTLEQYKRSVITEAVTKGLNPDTEMKDSGYDWLGFIPMSWKLQKGKYIFAQRSERGNTRELQLLSPTQNFGVIPQSLYEELSGMSAVKLNEHTDLQTMKTIHKGDYCISLRSFQGGFEYSGYEGVVSPAYQVFYPTVEISDGYYKYLFKDKGFIEKMNSYTMTLRDGKNIAFADFGNTYIPYPPINEQKAIANYLDVKVAKIDSIITSKQEQLAALAEYKKSLIFEYVTGKKEVPSASVVTTAIYPYFPAALNAKKPRFAQAVLMSKILDSGCTNMGRVKLEKMLYVIEYQLGFDFDTQYTRAAAGPLSPSIYECEGIISNRNKWFSINKARHSISYYPAKDMAKYRAYYKRYYAPYDAEICRIIGIFKNFTLDQAEVIATLFGAWNDFLINHKTFTDDDIVDEVWNNWNESKQRFPKDMWLRAIEKMKQLGITPKGYGKLTITKKEAPSA